MLKKAVQEIAKDMTSGIYSHLFLVDQDKWQLEISY